MVTTHTQALGFLGVTAMRSWKEDTINYHACGLRNNNAALCTKARKPVESKPVRSRDGECALMCVRSGNTLSQGSSQR
jgi:hypothetical protein